MGQENRILENLIREKLGGFTVQPSKDLWTKVASKIWLRNFIKFSWNKFNIYYAGSVAALGIVAVTSLPTIFSGSQEKFSGIKITSTVNKDIIDENTNLLNHSPDQNSELVASTAGVDNDVDETTLAMIAAENEKNAVVALFDASVIKGCAPLEVSFQNKSKNHKSIRWIFNDGQFSEASAPVHIFKKPGKYDVTLEVNGKDERLYTYLRTIYVYDSPRAGFDIDMNASSFPQRKVIFRNQSSDAVSYRWYFGDEQVSTEVNPSHTYPDNREYKVKLIAYSQGNCIDSSVMNSNYLLVECKLAFPTNFTPKPFNRSEGFYEKERDNASVFHPSTYSGVQKYHLAVHNEQKKVVFETSNVKQGWNGYNKGILAPKGRYTWEADGVYANGQEFHLKGYVNLIIDDSFEYTQP